MASSSDSQARARLTRKFTGAVVASLASLVLVWWSGPLAAIAIFLSLMWNLWLEVAHGLAARQRKRIELHFWQIIVLGLIVIVQTGGLFIALAPA